MTEEHYLHSSPLFHFKGEESLKFNRKAQCALVKLTFTTMKQHIYSSKLPLCRVFCFVFWKMLLYQPTFSKMYLFLRVEC